MKESAMLGIMMIFIFRQRESGRADYDGERADWNNTLMYVQGCANPIKYLYLQGHFSKEI